MKLIVGAIELVNEKKRIIIYSRIILRNFNIKI